MQGQQVTQPEMTLWQLRAEARNRLDALVRGKSWHTVDGRYFRNPDDCEREYQRLKEQYHSHLSRIDDAIAAQDADYVRPMGVCEQRVAAYARELRAEADAILSRHGIDIRARLEGAIDDALSPQWQRRIGREVA